MRAAGKGACEVWLAGSSCETWSRARRGEVKRESAHTQMSGTAYVGTEVCVLSSVTREMNKLSWLGEFFVVH